MQDAKDGFNRRNTQNPAKLLMSEKVSASLSEDFMRRVKSVRQDSSAEALKALRLKSVRL